MPRVLIADEVAPECAEILRKGGIEVENRGRMKPEELKAIVGGFDGLIVRSAVKVTREILEAGTKLKIVGRAGIGVDNIDQETATRRGIVVMNAPQGNVVSAAEHAFALLLSLARQVVRADASVRAGKWERSAFHGVQLEQKTLGVVGLGKIGACVARMARGFRMRVLGHDPFLSRERAAALEVELVDLETLLAKSDFISLHVPLTDRTRGMIGAAQFAKMKRTARLINTSRGGVVDEKALVQALRAREIAGAALDVYEQEPPPKDHPLFQMENVVLTPHLAASTEEAQVKVSVDIAEQMVDFFHNGLTRNAVNLAAPIEPAMVPYLRLAADVGGLAAQLADGPLRRIQVLYAGPIAGGEVGAVTQSAAAGALRPQFGEDVNAVNARFVAQEAGIEVKESRSPDSGDFRNLVSVQVETEKVVRTVSGTVFEGRNSRIVRIDDLDIDLRPRRYMLCLGYRDVPGVVGKVGTVLGNRNINIARMEVGRTRKGERATALITVDSPVTPDLVEEIRRVVPNLEDIRSIYLP